MGLICTHKLCNIVLSIIAEGLRLHSTDAATRWNDEPVLFSAENATAGVLVRLQTASGLWTHSFPNVSLPPECRTTISCGRIESEIVEGAIITEGVTQFIATVPVVRGLLLLDVRVTNSNVVSLWNSTVVSAAFYQCNPVLFVPHINYTICASSRSGEPISESLSFKLLQLQITYNNRSEIQHAWLAKSDIQIPLGSTPTFFLAELGDNDYDRRQLLIASDRLYKFSPRLNSLDELQNPVRSRIRRIESTQSSSTILVYGEEKFSFFDFGGELVVNVSRYNASVDGYQYPVVCFPDPNVQLHISNVGGTHTAHFGTWEQNLTTLRQYMLLGESPILDSVQCFGSKDNLHLTYMDTQRSLYVLDLSTGYFLPWAQVNDIIRPPLVPNNDYILIVNHTHPNSQNMSVLVLSIKQGSFTYTGETMYPSTVIVQLWNRRYPTFASPGGQANNGAVIGGVLSAAAFVTILIAALVIW